MLLWTLKLWRGCKDVSRNEEERGSAALEGATSLTSASGKPSVFEKVSRDFTAGLDSKDVVLHSHCAAQFDRQWGLRQFRTMTPKSPQTSGSKSGPSDDEVLRNTYLLQHAEDSRLAKSWLGGFQFADGDDGDDEGTEAAAETARLNKTKEMFSDEGGVGYHESENGGKNSRGSAGDASTIALRKQMLGGRHGARHDGQYQKHTASATRPQPVQRARREIDSDDEESRATVGKKRGTVRAKVVDTNEPDLPLEPASTSATRSQSKTSKKRGTSSYLDDLLASRASKKQKKDKAKTAGGLGPP